MQNSETNAPIPGLVLYDALVNNSLPDVKRCVELYKLDLNACLSHVRRRGHTGLCPVHLVASKGYLEMLQYLIQLGVNVQLATSTLNRRAVHYAALRHQASCLQTLLNAGAKLDARDTFGNTPLHYAAEDGEVGLIGLLLSNGACVDSQDIMSKTALMKATRSKKLWAVRKLIGAGANVNLRDRHDETALHYACRQDSTAITNMLIKAGAKLNAQNSIGLTPLMEAVSYNQRDAVRLLVRKRELDLYKRDFCSGDTALHIAVKKNYVHIVEILLNAGNWYIEYNFNNLGESFVYDLIVYNRLDLLRLLLAYNYNFDQPAKRVLTRSPCSAGEACSSTADSSVAIQPFCKSPFQLALDKGHLEMCKILSDVCCFSTRLAGLSVPATLTTGTLSRRFACLDEVKPLKHWCRKLIRQCLGFNLLDALPKLSLPAPLKDFLLLGDIDWSANSSSAYGPSVVVPDRAILVRSPNRTRHTQRC